MSAPHPVIRLGLTASLLVGAILGISCGPPPVNCHLDPYCNSGDLGAFCENDSECRDGYCCESKSCNDGMCSLPCDGSDECPGGFKCSGGSCFFACNNDSQCANGQDCDKGACKW
ncbi:MAG: hypothetical protein JNL82_41780 [Myxococcales bacterium]|nr:hypothetical protein [Myxococcales bacterium]